MRSVAVIGVAGPVGQSLVRRLAADPSVERLVGVDDRDPEIRSRRLEFHRLDPVRADLSPVLTGVDSVAHVDLQGDGAGDGAPVLESARRVLAASAAAGIGTLVYTSSATVYGAWPTNPVPLTEAAPTRPNPGFAYAIAQAEAERLTADWRDDRAGVSLAVLRPVTVQRGCAVPHAVRARGAFATGGVYR